MQRVESWKVSLSTGGVNIMVTLNKDELPENMRLLFERLWDENPDPIPFAVAVWNARWDQTQGVNDA